MAPSLSYWWRYLYGNSQTFCHEIPLKPIKRDMSAKSNNIEFVIYLKRYIRLTATNLQVPVNFLIPEIPPR